METSVVCSTVGEVHDCALHLWGKTTGISCVRRQPERIGLITTLSAKSTGMWAAASRSLRLWIASKRASRAASCSSTRHILPSKSGSARRFLQVEESVSGYTYSIRYLPNQLILKAEINW
jgi:hypothetical protein